MIAPAHDTIEPILLTPRDAAAALAVSERTLWSLSSPRGKLPTVRIGRAVRYRVADLESFVAQHQEGGQP
jgi:predicted DNA-binding transcriptional regulator AlpA